MITRAYRYFRWLSLDVTAGAIVLMIFFCQELGVNYFWQEYTALGLAVWLIYTLDHLKDATRLIYPVAERRKFHKQHFKSLKTIALVVAFAGLVLCWFVSDIILVPGILVASFSAFYLFVSKRIDGFKELWVAITFAVGVLLVPLVRSGMEATTFLVLSALVTLALINLILFSHFEKSEDVEEGFRSFASVMGDKLVLVTLITSFLLLASFLFLIWQVTGSFALITFFSLAELLYLGIWQIKWFHSMERYRIAGDAIFLLPIVFIVT